MPEEASPGPSFPSIKGGTAPDRRDIAPVPRLSDETVARIREVARQSRIEHPLPAGVGPQMHSHR